MNKKILNMYVATVCFVIEYTAVFYILFLLVPAQMADLWLCSKNVKRKKSDLCEIDIIMSSLRDIGQEML